MLSVPLINRSLALNTGLGETPLETEDFNFFDYLLKLQAPLDEISEGAGRALIDGDTDESVHADMQRKPISDSPFAVTGLPMLDGLPRILSPKLFDSSKVDASIEAPSSPQYFDKAALPERPGESVFPVRDLKLPVQEWLGVKQATMSDRLKATDPSGDRDHRLDQSRVSSTASAHRISVQRYQRLGNARPIQSDMTTPKSEQLTTEPPVEKVPVGFHPKRVGELLPARSLEPERHPSIVYARNSETAPDFSSLPVVDTKASGTARKVEHLSVPEVMERIEAMANEGGGEMTVSLSPPELGRVDIKVSTKGGRVEVEMVSENSFAKTVLESSLADLKQALEQQDLTLSRVEVFSDGGLQNHNGFSFSPNSQGGRERPEWQDAPAVFEPNEPMPRIGLRPTRSVARSGVDLKI